MPNPKPSLNLAKTMEKLTKTNRRIKIEFVRLASVASVGFSLLFAANTFGQAPPLGGGPPTGAPAPAAEATAERVIVTGSNIPTSEETGPNPVDTYRTEDLQKLGVVNQTDLLNKLPIEAGGTVNQNIANGGDGAVIPNLRGLLPKETLVLVDGKRVASLLWGDSITSELQPGPHRLRISNTLYWKTVDFHVRTGEQVFFEAISHMGPGSIFMILLLGVGPLYMTVKRMN